MVGIGVHGAILIKDDLLTIDEVVPAFAGPEGISLLVGQDDRVVDTERSDLHQRIAFVGAKFIEGGTRIPSESGLLSYSGKKLTFGQWLSHKIHRTMFVRWIFIFTERRART